MELIKASGHDFEQITDFYRYVIDNTPEMQVFGKWVYGLHPTDEMIRKYIDSGEMYYFAENEKIIACAALTMFQTKDYHPVKWNISLSDDEVSVIHIICVDPKKQKHGIAGKLIQQLIFLSKRAGKKAIRLDALSCNIPAHKLYKSLNFIKCGTQNWYAENTGYTDFYLYENIL